MNFPIPQPQKPRRSPAFPDGHHHSKALKNVFPEKRHGGSFAGLYMPVCRFVIVITGGRDAPETFHRTVPDHVLHVG